MGHGQVSVPTCPTEWWHLGLLTFPEFVLRVPILAGCHRFKLTYRVFASSQNRVRGHYREGPVCPLFHFLRKECLTTLLPSSDSTKQPSGGSAARFLKCYLNPVVLIGNEPPAGNDSGLLFVELVLLLVGHPGDAQADQHGRSD